MDQVEMRRRQNEISDKIDQIREFLDDLEFRTYEDDNDLSWFDRTENALAVAEDHINSRL